MNSAQYFYYKKAYEYALKTMKDFYKCNHNIENFRDLFVRYYKQKNLDPDGKAIRFEFGINCTADALCSINRICSLEEKNEAIISVYEKYREFPIFFFPSEIGGINTSRYVVFGDRIDHTLYDLKMHYAGDTNRCLLKNAFGRPKTSLWLKRMESFENIVDWLGIKGVFTDNEYNVLDLSYSKTIILTEYWTTTSYKMQWSANYYNNLKQKILEFYNK